VFTDPLPSSGCPVVARVDCRGNVFVESLPSNGYARHNIKTKLRAIRWGGMDWIDLTEGRDQLRALANTVINLRLHKMLGNF
jgi:hypothetical protein